MCIRDSPFLGFIEFIPRLAGNDFFLVLQVVDEDFLEIQDPWMTFDECQLDDSCLLYTSRCV